MTTIEVLIKTIPLLSGGPFEITQLNGWSNHTYLLKRNGDAFVVRIPTQPAAHWFNRQQEAKHVHAIAPFNIAPKTLYENPHTGVAIRQFLPGTTISDNPANITNEQLKGMADVLKKLHESPCAFSPLPLFEVFDRDMKHIEEYFSLDPRYKTLQKYAQHIQKKWPHVKTAPCHMDPNPHNFLCVQDKILLLDFEYAGQCDPAWDLAYTITYCNLSSEQEKLFLDHYSKDPVFQERVNDYKALTQWVQAIWVRQQFTHDHYPVSKEEMLQWEEKALAKAIELMQSRITDPQA